MGFSTSLRLNVILLCTLMLQHRLVAAVTFLNFDDCSSPESEGKVFIHQNATWLECKGGTLERYCIVEKVEGRVDCVPHYKIMEKMNEVLNSWKSFLVTGYYAQDTDYNYANCTIIQATRLNSLREAKTKRDCLDGRQHGDTTTAENIYCTMESTNVNYIEGSDWYTCKDKEFHLQRCVVKEDDEYKCVSAQKIMAAVGKDYFDEKAGSFCEKFFEDTSVLPNYENELKVCSEFTEGSAAPTASVAPPANPQPLPEPQASSETTVEIDQEETDAPEPSVQPEVEESGESSEEESVEKTTPASDEEEYYDDTTDAPTTPEPFTTTTARPRRRYRTRKPSTTRKPIIRPQPTPPRPDVTIVPLTTAVPEEKECRIKYGWYFGKCFNPVEAAHRMMERPLTETLGRPDKLFNLNLGQKTLRELLQVADAGYKKLNNQELDGPSIVELVEQVTGADKCTVITEKLPMHDSIYWQIAKPCKCTEYECNYYTN